MRAFTHRLKLPYSPDLSSNDIFLFPYVKNKLLGQRFPTPEEAADAFRTHVWRFNQSGKVLRQLFHLKTVNETKTLFILSICLNITLLSLLITIAYT